MNYKEALAEITYQLKDVGDYDVVYWDCIPTEILKICVEALEKQIPKNPKKMTYLLLKEDGWEYECPCCGLAVGRNDKYEISEERGYCESCGQALDWEVKE